MEIDITEYSYEDIALIHLEQSIVLYLHGNYPSALHLATASEEIFGAILKKLGRNNISIINRKTREDLYKHFNKKPPDKKDMNYYENYLKNAVKHFQEDQTKHFIAEVFKIQAREFIEKAVTNYELIYSKKPEGGMFDSLPLPIDY